MIPYAALPTVNATLNATSVVLLLAGYRAIRRRDVRRHRACMLAAFTTSIAFLTSYLVYHAHVGTTRFPGAGWRRGLYLAILFSHTPLAALVPFLAITVIVFALRGAFSRHRAWAVWTLPVWLYVSVTGVVIYLMLYHLA